MISNIDISKLQQSDKAHVWHHITQHAQYQQSENFAPFVVEGKGARITDSAGKEYLDCLSGGVWTVNSGYGREEIALAMYEQVLKIPFFVSSWGNKPAAELAKKLHELLPDMSRTYLAPSGSEANEKGYKMVRQIASSSSDHNKYKIIYRDRDYHGATIGTLASCGHDQRRTDYGPFPDGFVSMPHCSCYRCPFNKTYGDCNIECAQELENIIEREGPDSVGAVILEPITAGGGVIVPVKEYFPIIQDICKKYGVLLHIDEVVCGMGRSGKWFGHEHFDINPDMVTLAKGLASGYAPIAALVTKDDIFKSLNQSSDDQKNYFRDISTYGGCTAGPAAALANIAIFEREELIENSRIVGDFLHTQLQDLVDKHAIIGEVRGKGLFAGIELVEDKQSKQPLHEAIVGKIIAQTKQLGVIIGATNRSLTNFNNTLVIAPPLICSKDDMQQAVEAVDQAIGVVSQGL